MGGDGNGAGSTGRNPGTARGIPDLTTKGDDGMSEDIKWMIRTLVAAIVVTGLGITAITVTVAGLQFNRIRADLRHHEDRVNTVNSDALAALQRFFDDTRLQDRDRVRAVDELSHELRATRERLNDREDSPTPPTAVERTLSNVERVLSGFIHSGPALTPYVVHSLEQIRDELETLNRHLARESGTPSTTGEAPEPEGAAAPPPTEGDAVQTPNGSSEARP